MPRFSLLLAVVGTAIPVCADAITINFDFYPGPDNVLGTPDDVPIVAPTTFTAQPLQITNEFAALGIVFSTPVVQDRNEILDNATFAVPPAATEPNLMGSVGANSIEASFTVPVFEVGAIIGISGGTDRLEIFDSGGASLGTIVGDDAVVSLTSTTPIARFVITPASGTTAAIDNLFFVTGSACYANCDGSTGQPALTANDFQCFINKFASNDPYANCDGSTGTPALTANDFQCFINEFASGCP